MVILAVVTVRSAARFTVYIYMISLACQPTTRYTYHSTISEKQMLTFCQMLDTHSAVQHCDNEIIAMKYTKPDP
jgi:hypothetical protein